MKIYLEGMHISQHALQIAGGIILFLIAIRMIFPDHSHDHDTKDIAEPFHCSPSYSL